MSKRIHTTSRRTARSLKALNVSISVAILLALLKFAAGLWTHSMAIMASALDSLMDVGSSSVNRIALRVAAKPPDEDHAYGHGKIESLAGLFQSLFITVSGLFIIVEAVRRFFSGSHLTEIPTGIGIMVFSMIASGFIVWKIHSVSHGSSSLILSSERLHYAMDILTNGGIIATLVLVQWTGSAGWDLVVSIAIAGYILYSAFHILKRSVDELLDKSLPPASIHEIEGIIYDHHPSITGVHNFRSRRVGENIFLDFHIEIRGEDDFKRAHLLTETMIASIRHRYPKADVTVHYDPEGEI